MPTAAVLQQLSRWDGVLPTPISTIMAGHAIEVLLLQGIGLLADSILGSALESASLRGAGALIGSSTGHATETALLQALGRLIVSSLGVATETASLTGVGKLVGSSTGSSVETAVLKAVGALLFSATGHGTETAVLKAAGGLLSSFQGTASEIAVLKGSGRLVDSALGFASVVGTLINGSGALSEHILGQAIAVGLLRGAGKLSSAEVGASLVSGILHDASASGSISVSLIGSAILFGQLLGAALTPPLKSFGVSLTNPAMLDVDISGHRTFIHPDGAQAITPSADGWALPGQKLMNGRLLILPGSGRLSGHSYTVFASGTITASSSGIATIKLGQNYFSATDFLQRDAMAQIPIVLTAGQAASWSIVCHLYGNGRHNGALIGNSVLVVNGVFAGGDSRQSDFNPLEEPLVQLSVGVDFVGSVPPQATLVQFDLR